MSNPLLVSSFTPSTMAPEVLEAIFVSRDALAERMVDSLAAAVVDGDIEHHLVVGPRGMGKTHLLTIVVNRLRARPLGTALAVSWLREEEWGVTNIGELYEEVLLQLADDPTAERALAAAARHAADRLVTTDPEILADVAEGLLTEVLDGRRLVVLIENLDLVLSTIGGDDQHRLRAYLQTQRNIVLLASSPSLTPSIATRDGLFFGFFAIHHLDELTVAEAQDLLLRIAGLRDDDENRDLQAFLRTPEATNRLKAVARIAGGHPRLWVLMSECITTERLDEIVGLLHALLDDLTPYYQAQMTSLSVQQRKVVSVMARADGALAVKDIATGARQAPNATAKHLGDLVRRGFVRPAGLPAGVAVGDNRSRSYELREPLLRHALEVKESRGRPLGLVVAFLRAWYEPDVLLRLAVDSGPLAAHYIEAALDSYGEKPTALEGLLASLQSLNESSSTRTQALPLIDEFLAAHPGDPGARFVRAFQLLVEERETEADEQLRDLVDETPTGLGVLDVWQTVARVTYADRLQDRNQLDRALEVLTVPAGGHFEPLLATSRGEVLLAMDRASEARVQLEESIRVYEPSARAHHVLALTSAALGHHAEALVSAERAAELDHDDPTFAWELYRATIRYERAVPTPELIARAVEHPDRIKDRPAQIGSTLDAIAEFVPPRDHHRAVREVFSAAQGEAWVEDLGAGVIVHVASSTFRELALRGKATWLVAVSGAAASSGADVTITRWLRALAGYLATGDGARLLELPPEIRDLGASLRSPGARTEAEEAGPVTGD